MLHSSICNIKRGKLNILEKVLKSLLVKMLWSEVARKESSLLTRSSRQGQPACVTPTPSTVLSR